MTSFFGFLKKKKLNESEAVSEEKGIIGRYYENEFPVIVKFVNEIPNDSIIKKLPILTVVSWKYEGEANNGMPLHEINKKMIDLEVAIENIINSFKKYQHAYSRTGNNLKELVYYSTSQDDFMASFNKALTTHERYPIEIFFYEDPEWKEFKKLIKDFKKV
jgi:hypothetical protein